MTSYYVATGNPPAATRGLSAQLRAEFTLIVTAFNAAQADILARSIKAGDTYTGTHDYTGATLKAPTKAVGTNTTDVATTAFVVATSLAATLPGQTSNAGKVITTDGTTASWASSLKASVIRLADGTDATKLAAFSLASLTTGTTRTITIPDKNGTMAMTSDVALTKSFTSAEQTITNGGALTIAHSLGAIPTIVLGYLKCVTAEAGYSIGDVLCMPLGIGAAANVGLSIVPDATNLNVRYGGSALQILNKGTGVTASITPANWTFSLRAYA